MPSWQQRSDFSILLGSNPHFSLCSAFCPLWELLHIRDHPRFQSSGVVVPPIGTVQLIWQICSRRSPQWLDNRKLGTWPPSWRRFSQWRSNIILTEGGTQVLVKMKNLFIRRECQYFLKALNLQFLRVFVARVPGRKFRCKTTKDKLHPKLNVPSQQWPTHSTGDRIFRNSPF